MGLPNILEDLLNTTLESNTLRNWSIFQEKSGCIIFRLKFNGHVEAASCDQTTSYKKKSIKQTNRDYNRLRAHKEKQQESTTVSEPSHPLPNASGQNDYCGVKTRSQAKLQPEVPRLGESASLLDPNAHTFVMPMRSPIYPKEDDTDVDDRVSIPSDSEAGVPPLEESLPMAESPILPAVPESPVVRQSVVTPKVSHSSSPHYKHRDNINCSYYRTRQHWNKPKYFLHCQECQKLICSDCDSHGIHRRHIDFLVPYSTDMT